MATPRKPAPPAPAPATAPAAATPVAAPAAPAVVAAPTAAPPATAQKTSDGLWAWTKGAGKRIFWIGFGLAVGTAFLFCIVVCIGGISGGVYYFATQPSTVTKQTDTSPQKANGGVTTQKKDSSVPYVNPSLKNIDGNLNSIEEMLKSKSAPKKGTNKGDI